MIKIEVASQFSRYPGGRYKKDGPHSGEEFRDKLLVPAVEEALKHDSRVEVIFDGVSGMPSSFLEEAFGGLLRVRPEWSDDLVLRRLRLTARDSGYLPYLDLAVRYIKAEEKRRGGRRERI